MPEDRLALPTVRFMFTGDSGDDTKPDEPARPPKNMHVTITSFWKLISSPVDPKNHPKNNWIRRKLRPTASGNSDAQTILSYSNLLQIVDLNIIDLSKLSTRRPAVYQATVEFKPRTASDTPPSPEFVVVDQHNNAPELVGVTPSVIANA